MKTISHFITSFKNWNKNFVTTEYDYQNHQCEIATMFDLYLHNKEEFILYTAKFYAKHLKNRKLTLKHPYHNEIVCQMTYNFSPKDIGWGDATPAFVNFCFFIDKNNQFPFLLLQVHHFFDILVVEDKLIHFPHSPTFLKNRLGDVFTHFRNIDIAELCFKHKNFVFTLEQWRPYHYFSEILSAVYEIYQQSQEIIPIGKVSNFFSPKFCQIKNETEVFIRSVICPMGLKCKNSCLEESLKEFNSLIEKEDKEDALDKENLSSQELENLISRYKAN
ncbi:hypothetical protein [Helicobacter turcicus]|uniref:Uncharacterized protein n=1 Tax=Helicobacter turcicus TaxID=2867412 RepID=A0ABS7JQ33_9HELI|nr:hypothetical protein [Helicobacter turcicus]MBX7491508.1 hypothetical protein [Helicobacter turcicus]MBX7546365.1 hypothetical protein [Helicobacter turcicus]